MAIYTYKNYSESPQDRYRINIVTYTQGSISATSRKWAIEKAMLKVGMRPRGQFLEIRTGSGDIVGKFENTERPVEPWGRQWTDLSDKGMNYDSNVHNYHIRNGRVYYVLGTGVNAHALNPRKQ